MSSKRKTDIINEEEHKAETAGMMRWLLTYADMITLLLGLFIILAAASAVSKAKYEIISEQAAKTFFGGKYALFQGQGKVMPGAGHVLPYRRPVEQGEQGGPQPKPSPTEPKVIVAEGMNGTFISMPSGLLFDSGSAGLKPEARKTLDYVCETYFINNRNVIVINGHTDDRPISTAVFPSNWELSSGRAGSVARYVIDYCLVSPERITTAGYADTWPVVSNDTPENRSKNRRVEIWVLRGQVGRTLRAVSKEARRYQRMNVQQESQPAGGAGNLEP